MRLPEFFNKLKGTYDDYLKRMNTIKESLEWWLLGQDGRVQELLRMKLKQWRDKAHKTTEATLANRIAKFSENRYRISNARKLWRKLGSEYDRFINNRLLWEFRKKIVKYVFIKNMMNKIQNKFTKEAEDQFKKGIHFIETVRFIKMLFENWERRCQLLEMREVSWR